MKQLFQHFAKEEKEFVEQVIDLCQQIEESYVYRVTRFLNPKQDQIVASIAAYFGLSYFSSREQLNTEFSRGIIAPDYYQLEVIDFDIAVVEIFYPRKYYQLTHSQILGTLLNRLGIKREYIGDILIDEKQSLVVIDRKFLPLLETEIQKIGRTPVHWKESNWNAVQQYQQQPLHRKQLLLTSLRLDRLIASAFLISRTRASQLIEKKQVKVDYTLVTQTSWVIQPGQLISVRGFGRIYVKEQLGYSKHGKQKLDIEVIRK